jgi:hypothetical protein
MPRNDRDDGRPVLFKRDHGLPNLHCVLGAKLDNIFDLLEEACASPTAAPVNTFSATAAEPDPSQAIPGSTSE